MRARLRLAVALLLVVPVGGLFVGVGAGADPGAAVCRGTLESNAEGMTVVSVQGARFTGSGAKKTQARLVGFGPAGRVHWVWAMEGMVWGYDLDPMANGNLFVTATIREGGHGKSVFFEFDPETQSVVWREVLNYTDTHDADLVGEHRIAIAAMRNYDHSEGVSDDGLVIYDRRTDEVVDRWRFRAHGFQPSGGGNYTHDWTHVNDVDRVGEHRYLLSPRNFDQVVLVNTETGEIELRLGADNRWKTLKRQHNPQYLVSESGTPTLLVADSDNDRIVEYAKRDGGWERTWTLGSEASFDWPRDADRLPSGNTLVVDSRHNRVLEVTPRGKVVWEVYAPWLVYDAERVRVGDDDVREGPTIADLNAGGSYDLSNAPLFSETEMEACARALSTFEPSDAPAGAAGPTTPREAGAAAGTLVLVSLLLVVVYRS